MSACILPLVANEPGIVWQTNVDMVNSIDLLARSIWTLEHDEWLILAEAG